MAIGEDRGERHRMSLSRLATSDNALLGSNLAVPVLQRVSARGHDLYGVPSLVVGF